MKNENLWSFVDGHLFRGQTMLFALRAIPLVPWLKFFSFFEHIETFIQGQNYFVSVVILFLYFFSFVRKTFELIEIEKLTSFFCESGIEFTILRIKLF